jgi:hypothetical protein
MPVKMITPRQLAFLERLATERVLDAEAQVLFDARADMTARNASRFIDRLMAAPRVAAAPAQAATEGYYVRGEEVFVVVPNKAGTATYAKRLEAHVTESGARRGRWVYAPGAGRNLAAEGLTPLTVEEAGRLSNGYGFCVVCGRSLTATQSAARGIGPVCEARLRRVHAAA